MTGLGGEEDYNSLHKLYCPPHFAEHGNRAQTISHVQANRRGAVPVNGSSCIFRGQKNAVNNVLKRVTAVRRST